MVEVGEVAEVLVGELRAGFPQERAEVAGEAGEDAGGLLFAELFPDWDDCLGFYGCVIGTL